MKALVPLLFTAFLATVIAVASTPPVATVGAAQPNALTPLIARDTNPPTILPRIPAVPIVTNWPFTNLPPITNFARTNLPAMTNPPPLHPPGGP